MSRQSVFSYPAEFAVNADCGTRVFAQVPRDTLETIKIESLLYNRRQFRRRFHTLFWHPFGMEFVCCSRASATVIGMQRKSAAVFMNATFSKMCSLSLRQRHIQSIYIYILRKVGFHTASPSHTINSSSSISVLLFFAHGSIEVWPSVSELRQVTSTLLAAC